jgi:hypothetical protein
MDGKRFASVTNAISPYNFSGSTSAALVCHRNPKDVGSALVAARRSREDSAVPCHVSQSIFKLNKEFSSTNARLVSIFIVVAETETDPSTFSG